MANPGELIGIIDENITSAVEISQILEYAGFKTFQAYNPKEAISMVKSQKPALIILSSNLESGNFCSVAKDIQDLVKIIIVTERGEIPSCNLKHQILKIKKPINKGDLLAKVKKVLHK